MTQGADILIILLICNALIALIYLAVSIATYKKNKEKQRNRNFVILFLCMILCPVVVELLCLLAFIWYRVFFSEPVDLEDVIFSKDRIKSVVRAQEEQERNIVSLEEAIEITNDKDLRELMMNVVRGDIREYLASISLALKSNDSEVSHYAASVLQDTLNNFRMNVHKKRMEAEASEDKKSEKLSGLIDYINPVLEQNVFNNMEQAAFVKILGEVADELYELEPGVLSSEQFKNISLRYLETGDFENCEKWCNRAMLHFPDALATYTCRLKLYFESGRNEEFFSIMNELKKSGIVVDSETLEMMRTFS